MGGIGEAALAVGGALATGAEAVGGALATGAEAVGGALATGAEAVGSGLATVGSAIGKGAGIVGDTVATGASYVGDAASWAGEQVADFAQGIWEQGTDLTKTMGDVASYNTMQAVAQTTPDGLIDATKFVDTAGNTMYVGDVATDVNWSKTLGNLTGQAMKNYALNKVGLNQEDAYNLLGNVKEFGRTGNLISLLGDDRKSKKYGKLLSQLTGTDQLL